MAIKFSEIISRAEELCDGRSFSESKHFSWANSVRKSIATDALVRGFRGLYFLYREATVKDGSEKDQGRYMVPDDFVDDLRVFYDGTLLVKAPPEILDITNSNSSFQASSPTWFRLLGNEFDIIPAPTEDGKEIKLLYNASPETIQDVNFSDYFLDRFPDLHIFGIAKWGVISLGDKNGFALYKGMEDEEKKKLMLHNRRHYLKFSKLRFQTWDEFEEIKTFVFPQFRGEGGE